MKFFATTVPGIGALLVDEAGQGTREFDGRADVVVLEGQGTDPPLHLRTAEDVFVEVGHAARTASTRDLAAHLLDGDGLERGLSVLGAIRPLRAAMTFRVIARVRSEREFQRTAFREEMTSAIASARPRWRVGDPADVELWALETRRDGFRLGLRLTTSAHRQRGGRVEERAGALRPAVAAGMVQLAGPPSDAPLLDPCCGAGTVLAEARAVGWHAVGGDMDEVAIGAATRNVAVPLVHGDAVRLPLADAACAAVVTNLPFGRRYKLSERPVRWFNELLDELERVTQPGAPLVFLVPESSGWRVALERHARPANARVDIRLLGMETTIWRL